MAGVERNTKFAWDCPWAGRMKTANGESIYPNCVSEIVEGSLYVADSRLVSNKNFPKWAAGLSVSLVINVAPGEVTVRSSDNYEILEQSFRLLRRDENLLHTTMDELSQRIMQEIQEGKAVVVNCNAGADRSVTVVTAFILKHFEEINLNFSGGRNLFEVLFFIKERRPEAHLTKVERVLAKYDFIA